MLDFISHFHLNFDLIICKRRLIWLCAVFICPTNRLLIWVKHLPPICIYKLCSLASANILWMSLLQTI